MDITTPLLLSAIVAMADNRVIGHHNEVPWHLPADLKHFKALTLGKAILMGRKTYQSIGHPLAKRTNIVLTHDLHFQASGCQIVHSLDEALLYAKQQCHSELIVIGGTEIYQQTLKKVQELYLTMVHHPFQGDTYFPEIDETLWESLSVEHHPSDSANPYAYSFLHLKKRNLSFSSSPDHHVCFRAS